VVGRIGAQHGRGEGRRTGEQECGSDGDGMPAAGRASALGLLGFDHALFTVLQQRVMVP